MTKPLCQPNHTQLSLPVLAGAPSPNANPPLPEKTVASVVGREKRILHADATATINSCHIDLTGQCFGRWCVIAFHGKIESKDFWICKCTCGNSGLIMSYQLRKGLSKSCGCIKREPKNIPSIAKNPEMFTERLSATSLFTCWTWNGLTCRFGYGKTTSTFGTLAHRISWRLFVGEIPKGLCVLHRCDNPPCVNPFHLFLGTYQDNRNDCVSKGRHRAVNGESVNTAKLSTSDVLEIVEKYKSVRGDLAYSPKGSIKKLAAQYSVSRSAILNIVNGSTWKHLKLT